jgi:hypothetical protein
MFHALSFSSDCVYSVRLRNLLRRSDVPAWCPGWIVIESEVVSNIALLRSKAVSAAHGASVYQRRETIA